MAKLCEFGKRIKIELVKNDKNQAWLIESVRNDTGLYFDTGYMHRILTGELATPKIVESIKKILSIR